MRSVGSCKVRERVTGRRGGEQCEDSEEEERIGRVGGRDIVKRQNI